MTRVRRATSPPTAGDALNALDLALKKFIVSNVSAVNGAASTAVLSNSTVPSASGSASDSVSSSAISSGAVSTSASASTKSDVGSVVSESARPTSAVSETAAASFTPSASNAPAASAPENSAVSAAPRSASDRASSAPKNAAADPSATTHSESAASPTPSSSTPSSSTEKDLRTNATTSSEAVAQTSTPAPEPAPEPSSSASTTAAAPETSSSAVPETTASTEVPPSSSSQAPSSSSNAVPTQRMQTSSAVAATSSNRNEQVPSPSSSSAAASRPTSAASSTTGTANQRQNSPSDTSPEGFQSSASDAPASQNSDNLGNSLVGISPSSSIHVDSTLLTPHALTISSGDSTFITTPAIFTSFSVSSGKNGQPIATLTSVFANPTGAPQSADLSDSSFWDKKGAIAGVFTTVGLVILASILGIFYLCRRKGRGETGHPFSKTTPQFRRFSGPPEMSQQPTTYQAVYPRRYAMDEPQRYLLAPSLASGPSNGHEDPATMRSASRGSSDAHAHQPGVLGLTGLLANPSSRVQEYHGPFGDYYRYISTGDTRLSTPPGETSGVGIAVTTDFTPKEEPKVAKPESEPEREAGLAAGAVPERRNGAPSPAPSTPSIYPPSLPAVPEKDEDDYLFYERETKRRPESQVQSPLPTPPPRAVVNDAPDPRNPFASPLDSVYDSTLKQSTAAPPPRILTNQAYRPLTPPDSCASHSPTTPQFSEAGGEIPTTKPLNVNPSPYLNAFLGRSISLRTEPLPRPRRNPLRLSASGASLQQNTDLP